MPHPLVTQLRFARSEFARCLEGISDEDARHRFLPMNRITSSLNGRMSLLFLSFFLLVAISVGATAWVVDTQNKDALIINLAGRQRMLVQQMTREALLFGLDGDEQILQSLNESIDTFDRTLNALISGGQVPYLPSQAVTVPGTKSEVILTGLHQVQSTWDTFNDRLDAVIVSEPADPTLAASVDAVEQLAPVLLQQADDVVRMYESASEEKVERLTWIQATFFFSALVLLVAGFFLKAYKELEAAQEQIIEKERLERELEVARDIQISILPRELSQLPCFDFGSLIEPMAAVGGDFFDVIDLGEDKLGIVAGDVSDHGVPAALFMAMTVTLLRAASRRIAEPIEVLRSVNRDLLEMNDTGMFVTILYGVMNCATREFEYARAGHTLPMLLDTKGEAVVLDHDSGQLLGLFPDPLIDVQRISLQPNNLLLVYTDGLAEAENSEGVMFGKDRLLDSLRGGLKNSAQEICATVWNSLAEFRGEIAQHDDVTLLVVKVE